MSLRSPSWRRTSCHPSANFQVPGALLTGELHPAEHFQPREANPPSAPGTASNFPAVTRPSRARVLGDHLVDLREPIAFDLRGPSPRIIDFRPRPELARGDFLRPPAHLAPDIPAVDSQLVTIAIDAAR